MTDKSSHEVTQLLVAWSDGDQAALERLVPMVHAELHRLARRYMGKERAGHTLQTSALVNEAYIRLIDWKNARWQNRAHFFGAAAEAMRRILIDRARRKLASRHGGGQHRVDIDEVEIAAPTGDEELLAVSEALERLESLDPKKGELVKLRYFAGLTNEQAAPLLGISVPTAKRWWTYARAWLYSNVKR